MTVDQTANFVRGGVSSSVGSADTTINVDDASTYPDPTAGRGEYNLVIWDLDQYVRPDLDPNAEIVRVTGRDTTNDTLTVQRGQENTTAASHPSTSELHLPSTSKDFDDIDSKITSNLTISGSDGLNGGSAELGGSIDVGISGNLSLDSDLEAVDGETIWDESQTYIPQGRLENDSMTIAGNSVSLGGSTSINHTNLSNINSDDHHSKYTDSEAVSAVESANPLSLQNDLKIQDGQKLQFGTDNDRQAQYDTGDSDLRIGGGSTSIKDEGGTYVAGLRVLPDTDFRQIKLIPYDSFTGGFQSGRRLEYNPNNAAWEMHYDFIFRSDVKDSNQDVIYDQSEGSFQSSPGSTSTTDPMFSRVGDKDSGLGFGAADQVDLITNGTQMFTINDTNSTVNIRGNDIVEVGGTTDANSGAIRLGSGTQSVYARDATTPQDFGLDFAENSGSPYVGVTSGADLRLATGQSIEDDSGVERFVINAGYTRIKDDAGNFVMIGDAGSHNRFYAHSGQPATIYDTEGSFDAVQYDTDASVGLLRTPNAGFAVQADFQDGNIRPKGLNGRYTGSQAVLESRDGNYSAQTLSFYGSLYDFSLNSADLRLATGQSIEDGGGNARLTIPNTDGTQLKDNGGTTRLRAWDSKYIRLEPSSGTPLRVRDMEGSFRAFEYLTSSSAPGTLELTNAHLNAENRITVNSGGGNRHIRFSNNAVWIARDKIASNGRLELTGFNATDIRTDASDNLIATFKDSGMVDMSPTSGNLRLATGQSIEDGGGNARFGVKGVATKMRDENGNIAVDINGGNIHRIFARSNAPLDIFDDEQSATGVQYKTGSPGSLEVVGGNADLFVGDGSGLVVGDTSRTNVGANDSPIQVVNTGSAESTISIARYSSNSFPGRLNIGKSRSGTAGSPGTAVQNGDQLGRVDFFGDDGTNMSNAGGRIEFRVDGSVSTDTIPGRFQVRTTNSSGTLIEALRINSGQQILAMQDGSESSPSIAFGNDTDTGIYRSGSDNVDITRNASKIASFGSDVALFGNVRFGGNQLRQVGGTTDASSGAIRLANGSEIRARKDSDNGDILLAKATSNDDIQIGFNSGSNNLILNPSNKVVEFAGSVITEVGGTTDASSGAIRMANDASIKWRDGGDNGDARLHYTSNDHFHLKGDSDQQVGVRLPAPNDGNVGTSDINEWEMMFNIDNNNTTAQVLVNDGSVSGGVNIGSYSTKRLKRSITSFQQETDPLSVEAKTFYKGRADSREQLGFIAEDFHDAGLHHAVEYTPVEDAWSDEDGVSDEYVDEYGKMMDYYGEGEEMVVPDGVDERALIAHLWEKVRELEEQVAG